MRINGKTYRIKEPVRMKLNGIVLIALAVIAHTEKANGAAFLLMIMGIAMTFPVKTMARMIHWVCLRILRFQRRNMYDS
jgi:hypothetical protein